MRRARAQRSLPPTYGPQKHNVTGPVAFGSDFTENLKMLMSTVGLCTQGQDLCGIPPQPLKVHLQIPPHNSPKYLTYNPLYTIHPPKCDLLIQTRREGGGGIPIAPSWYEQAPPPPPPRLPPRPSPPCQAPPRSYRRTPLPTPPSSTAISSAKCFLLSAAWPRWCPSCTSAAVGTVVLLLRLVRVPRSPSFRCKTYCPWSIWIQGYWHHPCLWVPRTTRRCIPILSILKSFSVNPFEFVKVAVDPNTPAVLFLVQHKLTF